MPHANDDTQYTLIYWPGIPGRGEYVRLVFEAAGVPYSEINDVPEMQKYLGGLRGSTDSITPTPHLWPPLLKIVRHTAAPDEPPRKSRKTGTGQGAKEGEGSEDVDYLSQSTVIVNYLGAKFGLVGDVDGDDEDERAIRRARVNQYVLTAQDLMVEAHDTHHPVAVALFYEDQKPEALRRAEWMRKDRIPKIFGHFNRALESNVDGAGKYLVGASLTVADTHLLQTFDGICFAFPRLTKALEKSGKYDALFAWRKGLDSEGKLGEYLKSGKRVPFSNGLFRHYEELDGEE